ncbi:MAG TPA: MerR family transcriptional regulator [Dehalococcoidia bacterium]|nr:MerR family transcriptional regulator [Dehalococcoidia bacterium]
MTGTIGEVARSTGLTIKAIRYYEAEGLLPKLHRTPAGYRLFSQQEVRWLSLLRKARELGLPLGELRPLAQRLTNATCGDIERHLRTLILEKQKEIKSELNRLSDLKTQLEQISARLETVEPCDCHLSDCDPDTCVVVGLDSPLRS